jgi:Fic family protein
MRVKEKSDLDQWFKCFLVGVVDTAKKGIATFDAILKLQQEVEALLQPLGSRAENARKVVRALYERPLVDAERVSEVTGLAPSSAYRLIRDMESIGILTEITGAQRGRRYLFDRYVGLFAS